MLFRNDKDKKDELASGVTRVPLLPLRDIIVFPHMVVPLFVGRQRSIKALEEATQKQGPIFLSSQKDAKTNEPTEEDIYKIGTLGTVVQMLKLPDGTVKVLIEGKKRAQVARFINNPDFFLVEVEDAPEVVERNTEVEALTREVHTTFENYVKLKKKIPPEMVMSVSSLDDPGRLQHAQRLAHRRPADAELAGQRLLPQPRAAWNLAGENPRPDRPREPIDQCPAVVLHDRHGSRP